MSEPLRLYTSPSHEPFLWQAGENAALLVHGFPGSPHEVRRLAVPLFEAGWTVHGILLPGFAGEMARLPEVTQVEWLRAVESALHLLFRDYANVVLVGNSMGAALALQAAARFPKTVAGLVLFSPFWRINSRAIDALFPLVASLLPDIRPFARADFSRPDLRESLLSFAEGADLDDPQVQQRIRTLTLPIHALAQVRLAGQMGFDAAPQVSAPVLVFAGTRDMLAAPGLTRRLAQRLPQLAGYVEVDSDHELAHMRHTSETHLLPIMTRFVENILRQRAPHRLPP